MNELPDRVFPLPFIWRGKRLFSVRLRVAVREAALPEVLRYVAGPLQAMTDGRLDSAILRQLLIALAMIIIMLMRPRGLWPSPEHGKSLTQKT